MQSMNHFKIMFSDNNVHGLSVLFWDVILCWCVVHGVLNDCECLQVTGLLGPEDEGPTNPLKCWQLHTQRTVSCSVPLL